MRNFLNAVSFLFVWLVAAAPPAGADVTLHQRFTVQFTPDRTETPRRVIFYGKGRRARFEGDAWRKKPTIFQFDKGLVLRLDPKKKTFIKVTLKDLENVLKDVEKIVKGVDEMLSGKKSDRRRARYRLKPTDVWKSVNGFRCRMYVVRRGKKNEIRAKVWITRESDAAKEYYALQREIANVAGNLLPPVDPELLDELERVGGTAVRIVLLGKSGLFGPIRTDMVVEKIDRRPLDDSLFEIPKGYRENADQKARDADPTKRKPSALERRFKALQKLCR